MPIEVVQTARLRTRNAIKSGDASGTYARYEDSGNLISETRFRVRFDGNNYLIESQPGRKGQRSHGYDHIVAVADRSGYCESYIRDGRTSVGVDANLYQRKELQSGRLPMRLLWCPNFLRVMLSRDVFAKFDIQVKRSKDGRYVGKYQLNESTKVRFETSPESGNNVTTVRVMSANGGESISTAKWMRNQGVWHIQEFQSESLNKEKRLVGREVLKIEQVRINLKLPSSLFSISSLKLSPGARIIDTTLNPIAYEYEIMTPRAGILISDEVRNLSLSSLVTE